MAEPFYFTKENNRNGTFISSIKVIEKNVSQTFMDMVFISLMWPWLRFSSQVLGLQRWVEMEITGMGKKSWLDFDFDRANSLG